MLVLSFFTQYLVYSWLDWKTGELLNPSITIDHKYLVKTDISEAKNFQLSYNNKYLSFINQDRLEVIDLYQNKSIFDSVLFFDSATKIINYRWLPDRNSLLFFSTEPDHLRTYLYSLDLNDNTPNEYNPKLDREFSFNIAAILNIEMSTYTNNLFVLFEDAEKKTRLIKMDIMKAINWLDLPQGNIHSIAVSNKLGKLFLESSHNHSKQISLLEGQERKIVSRHPDDFLLGSMDSTVYIGRVDDGYLQKIYMYSNNGETWISTNVWQGNIPLETKETFISSDKNLMIKHKQQLTIFLTEGIMNQTQLPEGHIVFSPTGNIYLQAIPTEAGFDYYWRSFEGYENS